jgi:nucleoid DNA-binding protein
MRVREPGKFSKADTEVRLQIYDFLANRFYEERGGILISRATAKAIFETLCDYIFAAVVERGSFRFPHGLGVLAIRQLKSSQRTLPGGEVVDLPMRPVVRYNEGSTVKIMLNKRDKYQERKEPKKIPTLHRGATSPFRK